MLAAFKALRTRKDLSDDVAGSESGFSVSRSARLDDGPTLSVGKGGSTRASTLSEGNVSGGDRNEEKGATVTATKRAHPHTRAALPRVSRAYQCWPTCGCSRRGCSSPSTSPRTPSSA